MSNIKYVPFGFSGNETSYPLNDQCNRDDLIEIFQEVFTAENSPYDEDWSYEDVDGFLEDTSQMDYTGVLAVDSTVDELVGFAWGYRIDPRNDLIDPEEKFPSEVQNVKPEMYDGDGFMLDEIGVDPDYRAQGIGTELESRLLEELDEDTEIERVMQRTQWSGQNIPKLQLDNNMGFDVLTFQDGRADKPVLQEVEFVGKDGSDERAYLTQELEGEKPCK